MFVYFFVILHVLFSFVGPIFLPILLNALFFCFYIYYIIRRSFFSISFLFPFVIVVAGSSNFFILEDRVQILARLNRNRNWNSTRTRNEHDYDNDDKDHDLVLIR